MSIQAIVTLNTLTCIQESDRGGSSHSEPYLWPFMAAVSNNSFETTPTAAILAECRRIRKQEMKAGQSVSMDFPGNRLTATYQDGQTGQALILVVALLEADDTPEHAIQAGYQAYLDELKLRIGQNILTLKSAVDTHDDALLQQTIDAIKKQVSDKVFAAIKDSLTFEEKAKVALGFLNNDDFIGSGFHFFGNLTPTGFTLDFQGDAGDPRVVFHFPGPPQITYFQAHFQVEGVLSVETITVDPCQWRIDGVHAAENKIKALHNMVASLQQQLSHATPQAKPGIIASIRQINEVQIPEAEKALDRAEAALRLCEIVGGAPEHPLPNLPAVA
jgi:hypothetical protein